MKSRNLLLTSLAALAVSNVAHANVVGPDAQNFNPTTSGLDFVTVQSSETLRPGIFNLGLFLNYAVNSLPYFNNSPQGRLNFNDTLLGMDFNAGVGLAKGWDIGISLPQILRQTVDDQNGARGEFAQTGGTEVRVNTKIRILGDDSRGVAFVISSNFNRIENNPYLGQDPGPTVNYEVAADTTIEKFAVGVNAGYRARSPGRKIPGSIANPLGSQFIASGAVSYHFPHLNTKLIGEVFGSMPAESTSNSDDERGLSSTELLIGAKHDINTNLALHAGAGTELVQGQASPDWRVYTGLNFTFGPVFNSIIPQARPRRPNRPLVPDEELLQSLGTEETELGTLEKFRTQGILFAFDSDQMVGKSAQVLEELAAQLREGFKTLVIEGHTDSIGPEAYNNKLSLRRAEAIKRALVSKYRLDARKIQAVGYGESRPIADNGNYQGRQLNRRVDFKVQR